MGGLPTKRTANGFAVSPTDPKVMYVAMRDGLFRTMNAGESWTPIGKGLKGLAAVAIHPKRPTEVYVVTLEGGLFSSGDGGTTWERQK